MTDLTRRNLMTSGLALSVPMLLPQVAGAEDRANPATLARSDGAIAPREQMLFDSGWRFAFGNGNDPEKDFGYGAGQADFAKTGDFKLAKAGFDDFSWRPIDL